MSVAFQPFLMTWAEQCQGASAEKLPQRGFRDRTLPRDSQKITLMERVRGVLQEAAQGLGSKGRGLPALKPHSQMTHCGEANDPDGEDTVSLTWETRVRSAHFSTEGPRLCQPRPSDPSSIRPGSSGPRRKGLAAHRGAGRLPLATPAGAPRAAELAGSQKRRGWAGCLCLIRTTEGL